MARELKKRESNSKDYESLMDEISRQGEDNARYIADLRYKIELQNEKKLQTQQKKNRVELAHYEKKLNEENAKAWKEYRDEALEGTFEQFRSTFNGSAEAAANEWNKLMKDRTAQALKEGLEKTFGVSRNSYGKLSIDLNSGSLTKQLGTTMSSSIDKAISEYTKYQASIDTRLIGYTTDAFQQIVDNQEKASVYYKTTDYLSSIQTLVEKGIAQDVEQRALLMTVKDELVTTFDATNETLLRLVRIQETDVTAARMGMEGYLNRFLNQNFENTEYLSQLFDTTSAYVEEATALMDASSATSTEYAIQKWLGSLYSVGMSSSGINTLAQALGQLGSGNVNDLIGTNVGNLIAVSSKGNLATYLKDGLTEATVNLLMESLVTYLQELNSSSNNVVKSQLASVFGLSISDLVAASNLNTSAIVGSTLSSSQAESYLADLMTSAGDRLTSATKYSNFVDNLMFSFGKNVADSDVLYGIYQSTKLLDEFFNGISIPTISVLGNSVDLKTTISDLLKTGTFLASGMELIGELIGGATLSSSLLNNYNSLAKGLKKESHGSGLTGSGTSLNAYVGNSSGSDIYDSTLAKADADANSKLDEAKTNAKEEATDDDISVVVPYIYNYLIGSFDSKMSSLVAMTSSLANYNIRLQDGGATYGSAMETILNGNKVVVSASTQEDTNTANLSTINENVSAIVLLLQSVISNGSMNVSVSGGVANVSSNITTLGSYRRS